MLILAAMFALSLVQFVPADFGAMFISFAAGGLAEMSLIALSLNFNPVVVALHHLVRILLTVRAHARSNARPRFMCMSLDHMTRLKTQTHNAE